MGILKKLLNKMAGVTEEMQSIYAEKGMCSEYVDAYIAAHKNPKPYDRLLIADQLISVKRYEEAEEMLDSVKISALSDDDTKGTGNFVRINLYLRTGRTDEAFEIFCKNKKFLDIYFGSPVRERMAGSYYDAAADVLSLKGDEQGAMQYIVCIRKWSQKYEAAFPVMSGISYVRVLRNLGDTQWQDEYASLKNQIENYGGYQMKWQKESTLNLLEDAVK